MMKQIRRLQAEREEGFTLIELLIVVIVLGILAAIVLFALGTFKSDSQAAACKTDAKSVETAEAAYYAKYSNYTGTIGDLVTKKYLKTDPNTTNNGYTLSVNTTDGSVSGCPS